MASGFTGIADAVVCLTQILLGCTVSWCASRLSIWLYLHFFPCGFSLAAETSCCLHTGSGNEFLSVSSLESMIDTSRYTNISTPDMSSWWFWGVCSTLALSFVVQLNPSCPKVVSWLIMHFLLGCLPLSFFLLHFPTLLSPPKLIIVLTFVVETTL